MRPRIGFIGLGNMGRPMAERLLGRRLRARGFRPRPRASCAFAGRAAAPASLAELGRTSEFVITILPDGEAVRGVIAGPGDCVADGLGAGSVVIDMSSASPVGTRALGQSLAARGVALVDAPVSGGVKRAADGSLAIMAGGDPAVDRALPPAPRGDGPADLPRRLARLRPCHEGAEQLRLGRGSRGGLRGGRDRPALRARSRDDGRYPQRLDRAQQQHRAQAEAACALGHLRVGLRALADGEGSAHRARAAEATDTPVPLAAGCVALWNAAEERSAPAPTTPRSRACSARRGSPCPTWTPARTR